MRIAPAIVLLGLTFASLPPADARVSNFSDSRGLNAGPYTLFLSVTPSPIFANSQVALSITTSLTASGKSVDVPVKVTAQGPDGANIGGSTTKLAPGSVEVSLAVLQRGNHTIHVEITDQSGTYNATTWIDAFPDITYRVQSYDASQDVITGYPTKLSFRVINTRTLTDAAELTDLTATIEHWTDDHSKVISQSQRLLGHGPDALRTLDQQFNDTGMYHIRFSSVKGNFTIEDVPMLHTYATKAPDGLNPNSSSRPTPGTTLISLFVLIVLTSLVRRPSP